MLYLGLMSGTSLDGVDLALCSFDGAGGYDIRKADTLPYPPAWEDRLRQAIELSGQALFQLDRDLGRFLGEQVQLFVQDVEEEIFVCSHGHTVFHSPQTGMTVQIGHGPSLREAAGKPTLYDFRSADVAAGGQGAPLVPVAERDLFSNYAACLNLGGFANITMLAGEKIIAFDICPCNTVLNDLANQLGMPYDAGGETASLGSLSPRLLEELNTLPYYMQPAPKSLGREMVSESVMPLLKAYDKNSVPDLLHTYTEHIAWAITSSIRDLPANSQVLITGGGAFNIYLIDRLKALAPNLSWVIPDIETICFKEAIAFAYLGYLYHYNLPGNIPYVTGASGVRQLGTFCR